MDFCKGDGFLVSLVCFSVLLLTRLGAGDTCSSIFLLLFNGCFLKLPKAEDLMEAFLEDFVCDALPDF